MTVDAFIQAACVPRHSSHSSGTLEEAEVILARYPEVAAANVYTAAILADEEGVRGFLQRDPQSATAKGGPHGWDALSYLCFSRYLRLDRTRSEAFVRTARILLDAGASANTGWIEMIDHPTPRPIVENAIYGAAAIARHPELTRLLLEYGADPNDGETAYHLPEGYDNTVLKILLGSRRFNHASLACLLARKADWHDHAGMHLVLEHGGDPNFSVNRATARSSKRCSATTRSAQLRCCSIMVRIRPSKATVMVSPPRSWPRAEDGAMCSACWNSAAFGPIFMAWTG
jgi:hypothetical protein